MSRRRNWLIAAGLMIAVAAAGAWWWLRPPEVEVVRVTKRTVQAVIDEEGKTRLATTFTIDMPMSGTLERPERKVGDTVAENDVVARIDPFEIRQEIQRLQAEIEQQQAQVEGVDTGKPKPQDIAAARAHALQTAASEAAARGELASARANLSQAQLEFERQQKLLGEGAVSRSQFDRAKKTYEALKGELERSESAVRAAEAARKAAELDAESLTASVNDNEYLRQVHGAAIEAVQAQLRVLQDRLEKTELKAPVSGVIIEKAVESRRVLQAGAPVFVIGRPEDIEVESDILSEEIERVHEGDPVNIAGEALLGKRVPGTVKRIYPSGFKKLSALGIEQQRVKIIIGFDNSKLGLRPEVRVDVEIVTASHPDVASVPERAIFREGGRWQALVIKGNRLKIAPLELGLRNDRWAEVLQGLVVGDLVVAEPDSGFKPGMRVRPETGSATEDSMD